MNKVEKELTDLVNEVSDIEPDYRGDGSIMYSVSDRMKIISYQDKHPTLCINNINIKLTLEELVNLVEALRRDTKAWVLFSRATDCNPRRAL